MLQHSPANNIQKAIDAIDEFCCKFWMMNLGPEKSKIAISALAGLHPKVLVELGGYCGYSALTWAAHTPTDTHIYTVEINEKFANVARRILEHAGVSSKVTIFVGDVDSMKDKLKALSHIDYLFIDHWKGVYLKDFKTIESLGLLHKGSVVVGDNIIYPGAPDYLENFRQDNNYESVLYHSYVEYSTTPDAVLVSIKL